MALSIGELVGYIDLDTSKAEKAAGSVGGMLEKVGGSWGKVLGAAGAAGGLLYGAGLVDAVGNEVGSDRLAASLGKGSKAAEAYGEIAGNVYSNGFGAGLEDVNGAIGAVVTSIKGMRSASDKEVQTMTEKAMTFADVMGVDVTRAAQVAGNMVANGLATNGGQAFDLLMKASQKVPAQLREDVLDATDEYGQFFNMLGIDGPAAMELLASGGDKGAYGIDKAGDAIKEFTIRATDGSKATTSALNALTGGAAKDFQDAFLAGGDIANAAMGDVVDALLKVKDPSDQAAQALALFGTPLEDLGVKNIPDFLKALQSGGDGLGKFKGAVDKAGATAYDNAATNLSMFGRTLKTEFVETIGGSVLPMLGDLTGQLNTGLGPAFGVVREAVSSTVGWLKEHQTVAGTLAGVIAALVAVTTLHGAAMAVSAAGGMVAWLTQTRLISGVTKVWTAVQWAMNAALAANPIGLVIVALVAIGAALVIAYKKSETFRNVVNGALNAVKNAAAALGGFFTRWGSAIAGALSSAWNSIKSGATNAWNAIKGATSTAWNAIKSVVSGAVQGVVGAVQGLAQIPGKVQAWFGQVKQAVETKFNEVVAFVKGIPGKITGALGDLGGLLQNAGRQVIQGLLDGIESMIGSVQSKLNKLTDMLPNWKGPASKDKKLLRRNGQLIMQGLMDGITDGTKDLKGLLRQVTDDLGKGKLAKVEKAIGDEYARGLRIAGKRRKLAKDLESAGTALEEAVKLRDDLFDSVKSSTKDFASALSFDAGDEPITGGAVVAHMRARLAAVEKFRQNMAALLAQGLDRTTYLDMVSKGVEGAGAMASALVEDPASVQAISALSGQIDAAAGGLAEDASASMYQAGVDTAQSIVDGLELDDAKLAEKAATIAEKIRKALADALGVTVDSVAGAGNPGGKGGKGGKPGKGGRDKDRDKGKGGKDGKDRDGRTGPIIGQVVQQPNESAETLAERLWYMTRTRG